MRLIILLFSTLLLSGCIQSTTPELLSPCVSATGINYHNDYMPDPCVMRPVNW